MATKRKQETPREKKKKKNVKANEMVRKRRAEIIKMKGSKCLDCRIGYSDYMYDLHHKDPSTKKFTLTGKNLTRKWDDVLAEVKKCILLCPNCHRKRHYKMSQALKKEY